jgi:serine/threonine protein kinase
MELRRVGRFKIVGKLGQGAMGEVFRAHDPVLGRDVAIKVVAGKLSDDERARERFLREARSAAQLNHPNIITVYDFGEEQGRAYMAMELLEGADLRELLAQSRIRSLEDKLALMEQILDGLAFAHAKGVVHRDLKPGNVHVLPNGQVKILDFGLARRAEDGAATGVVMGTPYYMAPEQAQGGRATARSDIFSLGAMFYEMLSGKRPFAGPAIPAVLFAVVHREPEALSPDLPPGLAAVVTRALSKGPDLRYADAAEMLQALRAVRARGEIEAPASAYAPSDQSPARGLPPALSAAADTSPDLRAALEEVDQYLDDRVPPLVVADSVALFAEAPVGSAASELLLWAERQRAAQYDLPLVDLLFHALHKLSVIGEFHLVEEAKLLAFLRAVGEALARSCPPGPDRDRFRRALTLLGESEMIRTGSVEMLRLRSEPPDEPVPAVAPSTPGLRRLSMLEQRLRGAQWPGAETARRRVVSQAIAAAATEARNESELQDHLRRLRAVGVESGAQQVFRNLGQELAD